MSPTSSSSIAWHQPIWRGSRTIEPANGITPRRTSGRPKLAWSAAMRMSVPSIISMPPARQAPLIAAISGLSIGIVAQRRRRHDERLVEHAPVPVVLRRPVAADQRQHGAEVAARAEGLVAGAGEDADAQRRVGDEVGDRVGEPAHELRRQRVARRRPVEREGRDRTVLGVDQHRRISGHRSALPFDCSSSATMRSRSSNFFTLPLGVSGNSSDEAEVLGQLVAAMLARQWSRSSSSVERLAVAQLDEGGRLLAHVRRRECRPPAPGGSPGGASGSSRPRPGRRSRRRG